MQIKKATKLCKKYLERLRKFQKIISFSNSTTCSSNQNRNSEESILSLINKRKPNQALSRNFYIDNEIFNKEMEYLFSNCWIFAGHDCEILNPGQWMTLQVGNNPIVIIRNNDNSLKAFYNICRHRGHLICQEDYGCSKKLVCKYHRWTYNLDGSLFNAPDMNKVKCEEDDPNFFDPERLSLKQVQVKSIDGYIFISLANDDDVPPFLTIQNVLGPFVKPYNLQNAKVAFESRIVEKGNWKIVWENNRECYHCKVHHPELSLTFPNWSTVAYNIEKKDNDEFIRDNELVEKCEGMGLASLKKIDDNKQNRSVRIALKRGAISMTLSGQPAIRNKTLGNFSMKEDTGDVCYYNYPNTWNHFQADHCISFRMLPISPTETELVTKWIVPKDAVEGVDYDLKTLTEVWLATNDQDRKLVESVQKGIASKVFEPGPYSIYHESPVISFVEWYCKTFKSGLERKLSKL